MTSPDPQATAEFLKTHVGRNRDTSFDQWPDRASGQPKGEDRLDRLVHFVIALMRDQALLMKPDAQAILELIAQRADEYVSAPNEERFHAMDAANS